MTKPLLWSMDGSGVARVVTPQPIECGRCRRMHALFLNFMGATFCVPCWRER